MNIQIASLALFGALMAAPLACAAPEWTQVELETSAFRGGKPSGWPHFQTLTISHQGQVEVSGWNLSASERHRGWATRAQIEALDRATRRARLGRDMPARLPGDTKDFTLRVASESSVRRGQVEGLLGNLGSKSTRLQPMVDALLAIAEAVVNPVRDPNVIQGRVDASGWRTVVIGPGGRELRLEPRAFAEKLQALDGAQVEIKGRVRRVSAGRYELRAEELLSPTLTDLRGQVDGDVLLVADARVQLSGPGLDVLRRLSATSAVIVGYVYQGPRGPRAAFVSGVLARASERDYPFAEDDELLLTSLRGWGNYVNAIRLSDDRESWTRLDKVALRPATPSAGAAGALSGLGQ
tara:strand:- start:894 stop:1949 length:1056 start_codon:yes stop_codon:yes gene_type:complete